MTRNRVWIALVVCFVLSFAGLALAQDVVKSGNSDALLDVLKTLQHKGVLTQQEYTQLKDRVNDEAQQPQAAPYLQTVAAQESEEKAMNVVSAMEHGVGIHTGRFDVAFDGEVNGFFIHNRPDTKQTFAVGGGCALCQISTGTQAIGGTGENNSDWSVRSGLLPSKLGISISTQEHGWNVAAYFGMWPAIGSGNGSSSTAGGQSDIDFRQNFATLGHKGFVTLKIGRDLGFFGQEAILNDMTLPGAGAPAPAGLGHGNAGNQIYVTFGRIGDGYIYTDFIPQVSYISPNFKGLQGSIGVFQPFQEQAPGLAPGSSALTGNSQPQIQGKLTYTAKPHHGVGVKLWGNFITQKETANATIVEPTTTLHIGDGIRATGGDYGFSATFHGLNIVGYAYNGWGLGTTELLLGGLGLNHAGNIDVRASQGWYGQGTYTIKKNTFGVSYGQSNLSPTASDVTKGIVRCNASYIAQYRLAVTSWDNLVAEYSHNTAENQAGEKGTNDSLALGTIVFF